MIKKYLSLITFSHTVFALPFALIGFFLAVRDYRYRITFDAAITILFVKMLLCMVLARSAAMAFNRYADAEIDARNNRTAKREIPAGVISKTSALVFIIICCLGFIVTTFFINSICFYLSPVALLVVLGYSYTKRFTSLAHFVLGAGLSLAPIGAYLVVSNHFAPLPVLFSFTVLFWVSGFDILYALQDEEFDKKEKLFSIPALIGRKNSLVLSSILHICCALVLISIGLLGFWGWLYWGGLIPFFSLLFYQHTLVKVNDISKVNRAFATTNSIASVLFSLFVLADLLLY